MIKKCRELNAEIVANAAKVQTALKLSEEDQTTIGSLKKEIEKAWKMVDASQEKVKIFDVDRANTTNPQNPSSRMGNRIFLVLQQSFQTLWMDRISWWSVTSGRVIAVGLQEARAKETIQQLKLEISNLTRLVEQGAGLTVGEESTLNDLMKQKDELVKERDAQVEHIVSLRNTVRDFCSSIMICCCFLVALICKLG